MFLVPDFTTTFSVGADFFGARSADAAYVSNHEVTDKVPKGPTPIPGSDVHPFFKGCFSSCAIDRSWVFLAELSSTSLVPIGFVFLLVTVAVTLCSTVFLATSSSTTEPDISAVSLAIVVSPLYNVRLGGGCFLSMWRVSQGRDRPLLSRTWGGERKRDKYSLSLLSSGCYFFLFEGGPPTIDTVPVPTEGFPTV